MTAKPSESNPRWLSAALTAVPILLSMLYAAVAGNSTANPPTKPTPPSATIASR